MTSWVVWGMAVMVAAVLGLTAYHFSVRTLRTVTLFIVLALLVAITAYGLTSPGGQPPSDLGSAFALGSDRLSGAFFHPLWSLWSGRLAPAPGRLGWAVIGAVLLIGYRQCEAWALRLQAPAIDTSKLSGGQPSFAAATAPGGSATEKQRHDWLAAELKFRLAAVQVHSPPVLPGGSRAGALASIAETSGVSGAGLAGAIIRFFSALWPNPSRYELRVWLEGQGRAETAADKTRVTVELDDPGSGVTVASKTVVAAGLDDAASIAAGYVAKQIFSRDPATPSWCYGATDGRDLGALLLARQKRVYVESTQDVSQSRADQIDELRKVTGSDRCAGVVRYELAQLEDLQQLHVDALRLHALNRDQYPRFFRGVYRLCMSLEMIAYPEFEFDEPDTVRTVLDEVLDMLCRNQVTAIDECEKADIVLSDRTGRYVLSHKLRTTLLDAAGSELRVIRRQLSLPFVLWNTFTRRDERAVWKPHLRPSTRHGFRDGVCVAELLVAVKQRLNAGAEPGGGTASGRTAAVAERFRREVGLRIVTAIAGDTEPIRAVLSLSSHNWLRWLPWRAHARSWQAAYNTACLYAVLLEAGRLDGRKKDQDGQDLIIRSLRSVVAHQSTGLERLSDWISNDLDFAPLLVDGSPYGKVTRYLSEQKLRDYPARQAPRDHARIPQQGTGPDGAATVGSSSPGSPGKDAASVACSASMTDSARTWAS